MKRFVHVYGDCDYAALTFEESEKFKQLGEIFKDAQHGEEILLDEEEEIFGMLYDFGEVPDSFVEFVRDHVQDYDDSKHRNFFAID